MIAASAAVVVAAVGVADPRPALTELQLAGRVDETLAAVDQTLAEDPEGASELGFDYLRGHLLESQGRIGEANDAFARALDAGAALRSYSLFRLAGNWLAQGHPEVAAGLFARVLSKGAPEPLADSATELLIRTIDAGGDCRLLRQLDTWALAASRKRRIELARADCDLRQGDRQQAANRLLALLSENHEDEPARGAAERLARLEDTETVAATPETALLIGRVFHQNRLFGLSITYLRRGLNGPATASKDDADDLYALARSYFWQQEYLLAAGAFGRLAASSRNPEVKARALYQQARCYELSGNWDAAGRSYRLAYLAEPDGRWSGAALVSALRLEWRGGDESSALELYGVLGQRREWRQLLARAAIFMASSDVVRGRPDRAALWLDHAARATVEVTEVDYWRGRLAELEGRPRDAIESYLATLTARRFHPFAQAARLRLESDALAPAAALLGRQLLRAPDASSQFHAWLLLGDDDPAGAEAREALRARLARTRSARGYLEVDQRPATDWPLWASNLREPEERLLALGMWREGSAAVARHFPVADASLGFTGSYLLSRGEDHRESLRLAEILGQRALAEVPAGLLPRRFLRQLYPLPWSDWIQEHARQRSVEPHLLAALIREESRFDRHAVSGSSARGLTQFVLPTARRLAPQLGLNNLRAAQLHDPEISIALGAVYLAELAGRYGNNAPQVIAAYNAGERQSELWRSYCYSREPEEYLSKVGFPETRQYLERVLISRAEYRELYPEL